MPAEVLKRKKRKKREERKEKKRRKGRDETIAFYLEVPSHFEQGEQSIASHKYVHITPERIQFFWKARVMEAVVEGRG